MTKELSEKRGFIDFLRGVAIFLMLWGHSIQYCCGEQFDFFENWAFKIIYSFHMPLFMLISGYLFFSSSQKRQMVELIEYRTKSLLYPILMCTILNFMLTKGGFSLCTGNISMLVSGISLSGLWFLWSVLSCSIAVAIAVKPFKNRFVQGLLLVFCIVVVVVFPGWQKNVYMYPYFVIGYLYARNEEKISKSFGVISIICTVIFVVMLFFYDKNHYIHTSGLFGTLSLKQSVKIDIFRWGIGVFGSVTAVWLCKLVYKHIKNCRISLGIESLGKNSLAVYALSVSLLSAYLPILVNKALEIFPMIQWNTCIWFYNLVVTPLVAIAYSVLLLFILRLFKKIGLYRLIFGR